MSSLQFLLHTMSEHPDPDILQAVRSFHNKCDLSLAQTRVCAFCGHGRFGLETHHSQCTPVLSRPKRLDFKTILKEYVVDNRLALYHTCSHLHTFMTVSNDNWPGRSAFNSAKEKCWACSKCHKDTSAMGWLTPNFNSCSYVKLLFFLPFRWLQFLSVVDIHYSVTLESKGYCKGEYGDRSVIHTPLMWLNKNGSQAEPMPGLFGRAISALLEVLLPTHPVYELAKPLLAVAYVLGRDAWHSIVAKAATRDPRGGAEGVERNTIHGGLLSNPRCSAAPDPVLGTVKPRCGGVKAEVKVSKHFTVDIDGTPVSAELAMYPYFYPDGCGAFVKRGEGVGSKYTLERYWEHRFHMPFSPFTRHPEYLMLMFNKVAALRVANAVQRVVVPREEFQRVRKLHPDVPPSLQLSSLAQDLVPPTEYFSARYFRRELNNLLRITQKHNRPPDFLLTVTADEGGKCPNIEYLNIEDYVRKFCGESWHAFPAECSRVFIAKTKLLLDTFILGGRLIFGAVDDFALKWETQSRGSLHIHLVLWLSNPVDVARTARGIMSYLPGVEDQHDTTQGVEETFRPLVEETFRPPPTGTVAREIYEVFDKKQRHKCSRECCLDANGVCNLRFPNEVHANADPVMRDTVKRYKYASFAPWDAYIVATHWLLALLCQSHTNMVICVQEAWSVYLLKYTFKPLQSGSLNITADDSLDRMLRQEIPDPFARKIAVAQAQITPLTCNDLALVATGTPITTISTRVSYIECKSPAARTVVMRKNVMAHLDHRDSMAQYLGRIRGEYRGIDIASLQMQRFHELFVVFSKPSLQKCFNDKFQQEKYVAALTQFTGAVCPSQCPLPAKYKPIFVGFDSWGDLVFRRSQKELVRFSVANPALDMEEFAFNLLCRDISFFSESDLLHDGSYVLSAVQRHHLLDTHDKIQQELSNYHRNRYSSALFTDACVDSLATLLADYVPTPMADCDITTVDSQRAEKLREDVTNALPCHDIDQQQRLVLESLMEAKGLFILTGGPGTGKSFLTKHLVKDLAHRGVMVSASTAHAAQLLSKSFGRTVHLNFAFHGRPPKGRGRVNPTNKRLTAVAKCRVHIVDEFTMLNKNAFNQLSYKIQQTQNLSGLTEVLANNLILLVGDHCQLPPVCSCKRARHQGICGSHSLVAHHAFRTAYEAGNMFQLSVCHRNSDWAHVLQHIRTTHDLTDEWVNTHINSRLKTGADLPADLRNFRAVCAYRAEVVEWNSKLLHAHFDADAVHDVFPHVEQVQVDAAGNIIPACTRQLKQADLTPHECKHVRSSSKKMQLLHCAVGAPVRFTENCNPDKNLVNSVRGVVHAMCVSDGVLRAVVVELDGEMHRIQRFQPETACIEKRFLRWFALPLTLDYAGTVHAYQGSTVTQPLIIDLKNVFEVGQGYVSISRSTDTDTMYLIHPLTAANLRVPNLAAFYAWLDSHISEPDHTDE